jgi:hypothetical protein
VSSLLVFDFRPLVGNANSAQIKLVLRILVGVLCYVLIVSGDWVKRQRFVTRGENRDEERKEAK